MDAAPRRALAYDETNGHTPGDKAEDKTEAKFDEAAYRAAGHTRGTIRVNGVPVTPGPNVDGSTTLLEWLRNDLGLKGAKLGCGEGGCGACTVMVSSVVGGAVKHRAVNACLMPALAALECDVVTTEGIAAGGASVVQSRLAEFDGSQCGFCTPGIVMALHSLFQQNRNLKVADVEEHFDGNLCRCTGYRPIWDAAKSLCSDGAQIEDLPAPCHTGADKKPCHAALPGAAAKDVVLVETTSSRCKRYAPFQAEAEKAPETAVAPAASMLVSNFWRPACLSDALDLKERYGAEARFVAGNTEIGIELRFGHKSHPQQYISLSAVSECVSVAAWAEGARIGASAPLQDVLEHFHLAPEHSRLWALSQMLRWFASTQIRNVCTLGGNLATASPISDMAPVLVAAGAVAHIASKARGGRNVSVEPGEFFTGYRRTAIGFDEALVHLDVPQESIDNVDVTIPYKQCRRREDDISIVTACFHASFRKTDTGFVVEEARFAFGGVAATVKLASNTCKALKGQDWGDRNAFEKASALLGDELRVTAGAPGGQSEYRTALALSFFFKFYVESCSKLGVGSIDPRELSAAQSFVTQPKPAMRGSQSIPQVAEGMVAGKGVPHKAGLLHVTGEARYVDDLRPPEGLLHGWLILAPAVGKILKVDSEQASKVTGSKLVFAADLLAAGGRNDIGPVVHDEEVFATTFAYHVGQVVGIAVAPTVELAKKAALLCKVLIEASIFPADSEKQPGYPTACVSIDEAVESESFYDHTRRVLDKAWPPTVGTGLVQVSGSMKVGGQEHFYLECNSTRATPLEDGGFDVVASTQAVSKTQAHVAHVCNVPQNKVVARTKRMGGGFGGKESRSLFASVAAAAAAKLCKAPVHLSLERDVDMKTTGGRHAFRCDYSASVDPATLALVTLDVRLYSNGGAFEDLSAGVLERALFHIDNCYNWQHFRAEGVVCKTAQPPATAFRGFGGPQGMVFTEHVMDHLAFALAGKDDPTMQSKLRVANLYTDQHETHFQQSLPADEWRVPRILSELKSDFEVAVEAAEVFNSANKFRKRGVALMPTKFGINFTVKFLNQGGALVHVYNDGSVLVSHGGTEMGQGLHTKVCQVVAQALGCSLDSVHVEETASDKVANMSPTAASASTDLYGMAALDACVQINERLKPMRDQLGDVPFPKLVNAAYFARIDLSAHGFYKVQESRCGWDWSKPNGERGMPFNYFTQGGALAVVEIDALTGDAAVLSAQLVVDCGSSLNPAIDIGQIEGAFSQGVGWLTTEELIVSEPSKKNHGWLRSPAGTLHTVGPGAYKLPAPNDCALELKVRVLEDAPNPFAVHSSKAVGEPPFFLGAAAFFAIRHAVSAARAEHCDVGDFVGFSAPATTERIRMACADPIAAGAVSALGGDAQTFQTSGSH